MNQQINLYHPDLFGKKVRLPSRVLAMVLGAAALVMLVLSLFLRYQVARDEQELADLVATANDQTERLATIQQEYPPAREDPALEKQIQMLSSQQNLKRQILQALESREIGNSSGFSRHLEGLARQDLPGTWLRRIVIDRGGRGLVLEGSALSPEMTPQLIQKLGNESIFSGLEFSRVELSRPAANPNRIDFLLATADSKKQE